MEKKTQKENKTQYFQNTFNLDWLITSFNHSVDPCNSRHLKQLEILKCRMQNFEKVNSKQRKRIKHKTP